MNLSCFQRFISLAPLQLLAGSNGRFDDGRSFRVVDATLHADGRCEFLAVAPLPGAVQAGTVQAGTVQADAAQDVEQSIETHGVGTIAVSALPLPYSLPD